jgi:hypothetical protein
MRPVVVNCRRVKNPDVYIGRATGKRGKWGNPYTHIPDKATLAVHIVGSREEAIAAYREYITNGEGRHLLEDLHELKGKTLGCWCAPLACHGDVLADLVEEHCKEDET